MSERQQQRSQFTTRSIDQFRPLFQNMLANWNVNQADVISSKAALFREVFDRVGVTRFGKAVQDVIAHHSVGFFPTVGEFMQYVPDQESRGTNSWEHTPEEWARMKAEQETPEWKAAYAKLQEMIEEANLRGRM